METWLRRILKSAQNNYINFLKISGIHTMKWKYGADFKNIYLLFKDKFKFFLVVNKLKWLDNN